MNFNTIKETDLSRYCSFRIGGVTKQFAEPKDENELIKTLNYVAERSFKPVIIGYGANTLFPDNPSDNLFFISLRRMSGITITDSVMSLYSGTPLSLLSIIGSIIDIDYSFTYLLPGSIGAAVYINARYMEKEVKDVISRVRYIDIEAVEKGVQTIDKTECCFEYKRSLFQEKDWLITSVNIELPRKIELPEHQANFLQKAVDDIANNRLNIYDVHNFNSFFRKAKDEFVHPKDLEFFTSIEKQRDKYQQFKFPSAGSVFQNSREIGKPIGQIVDELGLKGLKSGEAAISPYHGNIIINNGNAKAADVLKLIDIMTEKIFKAYCFQPKLEMEIIA